MNKNVTLEVFLKRRKSEWFEHMDAVEQRLEDDFRPPQLIGGGADIDCPCGPDDPWYYPEPNPNCGDDFNREVPAGEDQWGMASSMNGEFWTVELMQYANGVNFSAVDGGRGYWHITTAPDGGSLDSAFITADQWDGTYPIEIEMKWRGTQNTAQGIFLTQLVIGGTSSIIIDHDIIDPGVPPTFYSEFKSQLRASLSDGTNQVEATSQQVSNWVGPSYLYMKVIVLDPSTIGIKYWISGADEPDYIFATDGAVAFDPTQMNTMSIESNRPSQGSGIGESADVFFVDYITFLSGAGCGYDPGAWLLYDWFGDLSGIVDAAGNIQADNTIQDAYTIRAVTKEIGNSNTYELPSKAEYIMDVWLDGLHARPDQDWSFIAPRTIQVIPTVPNDVKVEALYVSKF